MSLATDEKTMSQVVSADPSFNRTSRNVSDGLRDGFIAAPIAFFSVGQFKHDEHARDAGILGSEAMADAYVAGEIIKFASFRERPYTDRSEGSFYRLSAGTDSSFISGHSLVLGLPPRSWLPSTLGDGGRQGSTHSLQE